VPGALGLNGPSEEEATCEGRAGRCGRAWLAGPDPRERFEMEIDFRISNKFGFRQDFEDFYKEI
jgi:hypothetical protein